MKLKNGFNNPMCEVKICIKGDIICGELLLLQGLQWAIS